MKWYNWFKNLNVCIVYFVPFFFFLIYQCWAFTMYQVLIWELYKDYFISYNNLLRYILLLSSLFNLFTENTSTIQFIGSHKNLQSKNINIRTQIWVYYFADYKNYATHYVSFSRSYQKLTIVLNCRKVQFLQRQKKVK